MRHFSRKSEAEFWSWHSRFSLTVDKKKLVITSRIKECVQGRQGGVRDRGRGRGECECLQFWPWCFLETRELFWRFLRGATIYTKLTPRPSKEYRTHPRWPWVWGQSPWGRCGKRRSCRMVLRTTLREYETKAAKHRAAWIAELGACICFLPLLSPREQTWRGKKRTLLVSFEVYVLLFVFRVHDAASTSSILSSLPRLYK